MILCIIALSLIGTIMHNSSGTRTEQFLAGAGFNAASKCLYKRSALLLTLIHETRRQKGSY